MLLTFKIQLDLSDEQQSIIDAMSSFLYYIGIGWV